MADRENKRYCRISVRLNKKEFQELKRKTNNISELIRNAITETTKIKSTINN